MTVHHHMGVTVGTSVVVDVMDLHRWRPLVELYGVVEGWRPKGVQVRLTHGVDLACNEMPLEASGTFAWWRLTKQRSAT